MASQNNLTAVFTDIANAIRDKKGSVATIKPINMADEINSIQVGDTNFKDLAERTITSVNDDTITKVGDNAFRNCNNLISVKLKSASYLYRYSFQECYKLTNVDLHLVETIREQSFWHSESLDTLIIRTNKVCTLSNTNALTSTKIATSTTEGYIYVPLSLVENYRSATNWTTYKSKIMPIDLLEGNYVEVDLGTLNWSKDEIGRMVSGGIKTLISLPSAANKIANIICSKYPTKTADQTYTKNEGISIEISGNISVYDTAYTDPTAFKTAIKGTILRYLPKE